MWGEVGRAFLARLAGYKVPKSVVVLREMPRLGSGKPDRGALARLTIEHAEPTDEVPYPLVLALWRAADPVTTLFCQRQSGGLRCALALAGGVDAAARHVRCALEGDAFCEWELSWRLASVTPGAVASQSTGRRT